MTPTEIIAQLEKTPGRLDKERIIKAAWDAGCLEFFEGAKIAYDALSTFGLKKVPLIEGDDDPTFVSALTWTKFKVILNKLQHRELTGNAARDVLRATADSSSIKDWNGWYRRILLKDLKCGVTETTINKILEKAGNTAKKYIIPVFSCQLAKNGDDHPKKMVGQKLIDVKLDGCLSAAWTVEFENGYKISIADVVTHRIKGNVKSFNTKTGKIEFNQIKNWAKNGIDINESSVKWFKLTLENGIQLPPLTGNHLVWLPVIKCWRRVDLLTVDDILLYDT